MGILRIITFIIIFFSLYQICNAQNSNQNQEVSDSLNEEQLMEDIKMAIEHYQNRQYKHAIHLFEKNIATLKAMYRDVPNLSSYLGLLNILSDCYQNTWQLEKYNELQAERDEIRMQIYENADWKVMFRIGNDLLNEGKYEKAQLVLEKLKVKTEKDFQRQSLNYIEVCNSLALLYKRRAMYDIAEKLYLEVKDICNSLLGKKSYEYVRTCNNLGMLYYEYGNYVKAELLLLEAKDILQKDIGKEDERGMYPQCCSNLGLLYIEQGLFKKAYDVLLESKDIREKIFTRKSEEYGQSCHNLALLYSRVGYYESALALYKEAKEIAEIFLGKNHPEYATYCDNLGGCYEELELYEEAESLRIEAKNIRKITLGINHPWYAYSCNNLGFFYSKRGFFKQALSLYQEALDIYEKQFGKEHTEYIKTLSNISALYYQEKLYENASPLISEAIKIEFDYLKKNLLHLSEKEKKDYFNTISSNRIGFYSILVKILENETSYKDLNVLLQNTFNFTLQSKGLMLSEVKKMKNHILHSSDTSLRNKLVAWQRYKTQISKIYNLPLADRERNTQQILFLENEINNLERYLFTKSSIFKETYENINIQLSDIQKNLKAGEVAVELIRTPLLPNDEYVFDYIGKGFSYDTLGSNGAVRVIKVISNKSPAYKIGLKINDEILSINDIITSGKSISQVSSLLKEESCKIEILSAETKSKKILIIKNDSVFVKKQADIIYLAFIITTQDIRTLLIKNAPSLETTYFQEYQKLMKVTMNPKVFEDTLLYNAFWKPIAEQLGENVKTVYLSPDGIYHQINLNTLQNPQTKKFVVEEGYQIQLLTNLKEILENKAQENTAKTALLFGRPQYRMSKEEYQTAVAKVRGNEEQTSEIQSTNQAVSEIQWRDLPETETEVNGVSKLLKNKKWKVEVFTGKEVLEERIKKVKNPAILHLATHGYFTPTNSKNQVNGMLASGLILSGVGTSDKGTQTDDGILTAYEATDLNLDQTELVVLSACETGLGEVATGEGVYGLQRGFKVAGARSLIMSLWKVDDKTTQDFMQRFYKEWLVNGKSKRNAFVEAQRQVRKEKAYPYYWGAFVMVGE